MTVLVINTGSSSIKYEVFDMDREQKLDGGCIERIGEGEIVDHKAGLQRIVADVLNPERGVIRDARELTAVGHRVVHGGESLTDPVIVTDAVISQIEENIPLAPLHNPANLLGIKVAQDLFPQVPQVAVFDTAFHRTLPAQAYLYALPYHLYSEHKVRRYGFHGTSHAYVAHEAAKLMKKPLSEINLITLHLGNGASVTAIRNGRSVDTSMGMTPLEGLVMGTRCGDIDPSIPFYLAGQLGMSLSEIANLLNQESGLKGLCGEGDMREVLARRQAKDVRAREALDIYAYRLRKYIGAYAAILGRVDGIVFTGGVGEKSAEIREDVLAGLGSLGIKLDQKLNAEDGDQPHFINGQDNVLKLMVIPTNEELHIARQVKNLLTA